MKDAATRELFEETGLKADDFEFINLVNDRKVNRMHYLQVGFIAINVKGDPIIKEPDKCEKWQWFKLTKLPQELFSGHNKQIKLFISKTNFLDD